MARVTPGLVPRMTFPSSSLRTIRCVFGKTVTQVILILVSGTEEQPGQIHKHLCFQEHKASFISSWLLSAHGLPAAHPRLNPVLFPF